MFLLGVSNHFIFLREFKPKNNAKDNFKCDPNHHFSPNPIFNFYII
jgi:hypothetical protein